MGMDLLYLARDNDLPPMWDGHRVEWEGWTTGPTMFLCPPPKRECCPACGAIVSAVTNRGVYRFLRERSGRWAHCTLLAFRCPDCRTDRVLDVSSGEWWNLEPEDYGDDGSRSTELVRPLFGGEGT